MKTSKKGTNMGNKSHGGKKAPAGKGAKGVKMPKDRY